MFQVQESSQVLRSNHRGLLCRIVNDNVLKAHPCGSMCQDLLPF